MKRTLPLSLLFVFLVTEAALAKAPTFKLVISGGSLASPIEVLDRAVLDLSNVCMGGFLDSTPGVAPPPGPHAVRYELWFFVKVPEGLRKIYVAYYVPSKTGRGIIYLPGRWDQWYVLNSGSILRDGQDGHWNYAAPAWEHAIQPLLRR